MSNSISSKQILFVSERSLPVSFETIPLEQVSLSDTSTLDLETTGLVFNYHKILLVILSNEQYVYVVDYNFVRRSDLFDKMSNVKLFLGHNLSFDLPFLIEEGFTIRTGQVYDTMETELTLVKGTKESVSLLNTLKRRLGIDVLDKSITEEFTYMSVNNCYFEDRHIRYAGEDVLYLEQIRDKQMNFVRANNQEELVQLNNNMVVVASYMKFYGMYINVEKWMAIYYENLKKCDQIEVELDKELALLGLEQKKRVKQRTVQLDAFDVLKGEDIVNKNLNHINYGSPDQIKNIFRYFNEPIPKATKKVKGVSEEKETTGTGELEQFLIRRPNSKLAPFIKKLIEYRVYQKRVSTYGKSFIEEHVSKKTGRIHPDFKINRTATGRLSSNNPNAQNIPALKEYRECFEGQGENLIYTCDLSSAELRILASLSSDTTLQKLYRDGEDLHGYLATPVYRYLFNDKTAVVDKKNHSDFRNRMKSVNFGIAYGASGSKVAQVLNIEKGKGDHVLDIISEVIPNAFNFLEEQRQVGMEVGIITFDDIYNQKRYFEKVVRRGRGEDVMISASELAGYGREAMNCRLQGVNGQMIKLALVTIFDYICDKGLKSRIISSVHDEIVIEVDPNEKEHCDFYRKAMIECSNYFLRGVEMEVEDKLLKVWSK